MRGQCLDGALGNFLSGVFPVQCLDGGLCNFRSDVYSETCGRLCSLSHFTLSHVTFHLSPFTFHLSPFTFTLLHLSILPCMHPSTLHLSFERCNDILSCFIVECVQGRAVASCCLCAFSLSRFHMSPFTFHLSLSPFTMTFPLSPFTFHVSPLN